MNSLWDKVHGILIQVILAGLETTAAKVTPFPNRAQNQQSLRHLIEFVCRSLQKLQRLQRKTSTTTTTAAKCKRQRLQEQIL